MKETLEKLINRQDLTSAEATAMMDAIMEGAVPPSVMAALLVALRMKGETAEEITALAQVMREKSTKIPVTGEQIIDTCGTGGDASGSINVSTTVALLLAGGGYKVAKHGNRSMTSKSGSADLLEALGVKIDLTPEQVGQCVERANIGFLFAPLLHSAMKNVVPVRKELAVRTIFNVLGPLTNPAGANVQIMGLFDANLVPVIAEVLRDLGLRSGYVVSGLGGFDEVSITENTRVCQITEDGEIKEFEFDPEIFGYEKQPLEAIRGGEAALNAEITLEILSGKRRDAMRDIIALNAGFAISAADDISLKEAFQKAERLLDEGAGIQALEQLKEVAASFS